MAWNFSITIQLCLDSIQLFDRVVNYKIEIDDLLYGYTAFIKNSHAYCTSEALLHVGMSV